MKFFLHMSNNGEVHRYALPGAWLAATSLLSIFAWILGAVRAALAITWKRRHYHAGAAQAPPSDKN